MNTGELEHLSLIRHRINFKIEVDHRTQEVGRFSDCDPLPTLAHDEDIPDFKPENRRNDRIVGACETGNLKRIGVIFVFEREGRDC